MSKRAMALLLGAMLVAMLAFTTACGGEDVAEPANVATPAPPVTNDANDTDDPPVDDEDPVEPGEAASHFPETLTIWGTNIGQTGIGSDNNDATRAWREIQYLTGTDITWRHPTYGDDDAFTLMIAAGDWPDVIQTNWLTGVPGGPAVYHLDGVILRLNDLIYSYMPNYLAALNATGVRHAIEIGENRDMLFLSGIQQPYQLAVIGPQIRLEWLEHVGLPMPTTTDELTTVLRAFRDNPLPENDSGDVRPMTGFGIRAMGAGASNFGMEMNLWPFGTSLNFYHINGQVTFGPMTDAFEDAVRWLRMLMEEGLIDEEWAVNERSDSDGRFMAGVSGFMPGIQMTGMHNLMADNHPDIVYNVVGVPHLTGPGGGPFVLNNRFIESIQFGHSTAAITTAAEDPAAVARFLDFLWTPDITIMHNFGFENETFYFDADGNPHYTQYMLDHIAQNTWAHYTFHLSTAFPTFRRFDAFAPTLHPNSAAAMAQWGDTMDTSRTLPALSFAGADADRVPTIMMDVNTYVEEMFVRFLNGVEPLDNFPQFRAAIEGMNIQEAIDAHQRAFDLIR